MRVDRWGHKPRERTVDKHGTDFHARNRLFDTVTSLHVGQSIDRLGSVGIDRD